MIEATKKTRPRRIGEDELLTTIEVAGHMKIKDIATIRSLITQGLLPATRIGRHYRVWRSDLDSYLSLNRTAG